MSSPSSRNWISFVSSLWLQTINGPNTDFPIYSSQLKELKNISQVQLNLLAFASDAGKLFGWFSGVAAQHMPLWLVAIVGAVLVLVGYGIQYIFLNHSNLQMWHMFMLTSLAGNGICWINTVCYLLCVNNFASRSRVAVSIATSYLGLSATVYTSLAESMPGVADARVYMLMNAVVPMIVILAVAPSLRVFDLKGDKMSTTDTALLVMFAITLATGACALTGSIASRVSSRERMVSLTVLLAIPVLIPVALRIRESMNTRAVVVIEAEFPVEEETVATEQPQVGVVIEVEEETVVEQAQEEVGGLRLLTKPNFWIYYCSYMFTVTVGLVFLNNLGQIAESRGLRRTSTLVSLSSSFGFFGRLLPSFLDYYFAKRGYSKSRTASMAWLMAPMAGAFFLMLNPSNILLYLSTAIIGTCTGAISSLAVSATSELFGNQNFGVNHNIVVSNIPIGSLMFGFFSAFLYQREAGGSATCSGPSCFQGTFMVWGASSIVGTLLCIVLYVRSPPPPPSYG